MAYVGTPTYRISPRYTLASIIAGEAANQGLVGMQAVGAVMANRAASNFSGYGSTVLDQALARNQFQGMGTPTATSYSVADALLAGTNPDPTGGATYYANPTTPGDASWAQNLNSSNSLQIGAHYFTNNTNGNVFTPNFTNTSASSNYPFDNSTNPMGSGASNSSTTSNYDGTTTSNSNVTKNATPIQAATYVGKQPKATATSSNPHSPNLVVAVDNQTATSAKNTSALTSQNAKDTATAAKTSTGIYASAVLFLENTFVRFAIIAVGGIMLFEGLNKMSGGSGNLTAIASTIGKTVEA